MKKPLLEALYYLLLPFAFYFLFMLSSQAQGMQNCKVNGTETANTTIAATVTGQHVATGIYQLFFGSKAGKQPVLRVQLPNVPTAEAAATSEKSHPNLFVGFLSEGAWQLLGKTNGSEQGTENTEGNSLAIRHFFNW